MSKVELLPLPGLRILTPARIEDSRGWFSEVWKRDVWESAGIVTDFRQENESLSRARGTVRGLHFQVEPFAQSKLVRVLEGRVLDVTVDLRKSSPTFGRSFSIMLDARSGSQLFVPIGFAHGFCTLEENTRVAYKVDAGYSPLHERGLLWNDPALRIDWPVAPGAAVMSEKDLHLPLLADLGDVFA